VGTQGDQFLRFFGAITLSFTEVKGNLMRLFSFFWRIGVGSSNSSPKDCGIFVFTELYKSLFFVVVSEVLTLGAFKTRITEKFGYI
jgi:hypothetical protein